MELVLGHADPVCRMLIRDMAHLSIRTGLHRSRQAEGLRSPARRRLRNGQRRPTVRHHHLVRSNATW